MCIVIVIRLRLCVCRCGLMCLDRISSLSNGVHPALGCYNLQHGLLYVHLDNAGMVLWVSEEMVKEWA